MRKLRRYAKPRRINPDYRQQKLDVMDAHLSEIWKWAEEERETLSEALRSLPICDGDEHT